MPRRREPRTHRVDDRAHTGGRLEGVRGHGTQVRVRLFRRVALGRGAAPRELQPGPRDVLFRACPGPITLTAIEEGDAPLDAEHGAVDLRALLFDDGPSPDERGKLHDAPGQPSRELRAL